MAQVMTTFDPKDAKYQINKNFKPDKEHLWQYPAEKDGWTYAHDSIRAEMRSLIEAIEAVNERNGGILEEWELKCIQKVWRGHEIHVHSHHSNEDDIMAPFLKTRFHYPEKMEADHDVLVTKLETLKNMVTGLKVGDNMSALLEQLIEYEAMMKPHLLQEEIECIPLFRAYFTPKEVGAKVQEILSKSPKCELGSFSHTLGVDKFRKEFMSQEGIPFFVWYIQFVWMYKHFCREFLAPVEALKLGLKPKKI